MPVFCFRTSAGPRSQLWIYVRHAENGFKTLAVLDDVSNMDLAKVGSESESLGHVSGALWQKTLVTSCVLAGCLALLAVLMIF